VIPRPLRSRIRSTLTLVAAVWCLAAAARQEAGVETFDRVWQIVNDTHFDTTFNGVDWPKVRDELRPRAIAAPTPDALRGVIRDMLARLGQSHFALVPSGGGADADTPADQSGWPGFDFRLDRNRAVVVALDPDGPATGKVEAGWTIASVGGRTVDQILSRFDRSQETALSRFESWRTLTAYVRGPIGSQVEIAFDDGSGTPRRVMLRRDPEPGERVQIGHFPMLAVRTYSRALTTPGGRTVGLIRFNAWMTPVDAFVLRAVDEFRTASGIVIDLRGNPGGLAAMVMGISGHFLSEPVLLGRMKTRDGELRLMANPRRVNASGQAVEPYAGPLAILVDGLTGSASECFTGGMQSLGRVRVFGTQTMGQALPALFDRLPNGDILVHAFGDFVTATGDRLEGRGVIPDVEVPISRDALAKGRDATLDKALEWVDGVHLRPRQGL
jgi:carboxyl-terminal processing protease